jgi:hypothetical protein
MANRFTLNKFFACTVFKNLSAKTVLFLFLSAVHFYRALLAASP